MKQAAVIFGLFVVTLLYFSDVLTGKLILGERDLTTFFYPFRLIWVETVRQGHFPFWNPYIKCGVPIFATIQPAILYPLSIPYLFLPLDLAFNWTIVLHFFLAAIFTYFLTRELGASMQAALFAALAFLLSGYLISVHNVLNTLLSVTWYPLVIFCGCNLVKRGMARWAVACAASLCCMFMGGGVEIVLLALASLVFLCLYPNILPLGETNDFINLRRRLRYLGLALIIFIGVSMVQLLPFLELYPLTIRYGGVTLDEATRWSLALQDLLYFLLPDLYGPRMSGNGYWEFQHYLKSVYVGPLVAGFAAIYFVVKGRRALAFLAAMLLVLGFAMGENALIYPFFHKHFPLFAALRYPVKFLFLFIFFLCIAAGLGLDYTSQRFAENREPSPWRQWLLVVTVIVLATVFFVTHFRPNSVAALLGQWGQTSLDPLFLPKILHNIKRLLVVTIFLLIVFFFGLRHRLTRLGSPMLLTLLFLDLFFGNRGYAIKLDASVYHAENEFISILQAEKSLFRFHALPEVMDIKVNLNSYEEHHRLRKERLEPDLMMEHHLFDVQGYNVPLQIRYERLVSLIRYKPLEAPVPALLNLLNVKYVLSAKSIDLPGYVWLRDGRWGSKLYENRNCLPRAFLARDFQVLQRKEDFARAFHDSNFAPQDIVLLESTPENFLKLKKEPAMPGLQQEVRVLTYENNRMLLGVSTPEAALLFMSEAYYPGWQAYVDGRQEEILRANYAFRAIPLGPGSHQVELIFQPTSFKVGLVASAATICLLLTAWLISSRSARKSGISNGRE